MSAVIDNMDFKEEKKDEEYREKLYSLAKEKGNEYVHKMLAEIDPISAKEIHPNNLKRVIRAIEMNNYGLKKSQHMENEKKRKENNNSKYDFILFCTYFPKEILNERINKRVDIMIQNGLEKEASVVYKLKSGTIKQAVGYKEFFDYFENKKTIDEVIDEIKLRTRQYAKRQNTWFKKMNNVNYIDMQDGIDSALNKIMERIYERESGI